MEVLSLPPEQLAAIVDVTSRAAHDILQSYAEDADIPTNWRTVISFRLGLDDLFHIQRTGCDMAIIFVNAYEFITLDKTDKARLGKFRLAAYKAIKLAASLSKSGNALITGDLAYAITKERKRLRREILSYGYNALDDRYFTVSGTLTVTDRLSGRTLTTNILPSVISLESQVSALKHALSLLMLQDSETEEIIDLLETSRSQRTTIIDDGASSYTISSVPNGINTTVKYDGSVHNPESINPFPLPPEPEEKEDEQSGLSLGEE